MQLTVVFLLALSGTASASLYDREPSVEQLTASNFQDKVIKSDDTWIVEFYAPWCGHCKALVPEYIKAAKALKGIVRVGGVDMDQHQAVGGPYGVKGFPTIKIFGGNKNSPTDYNGGRDAGSIAQAGVQALAEVVQTRLGGGSSGGGGSGPSKVVELTDSNFAEKVLNSKEPWMVAFVAPWCGHCKNLHPQYENAALQLDGKAFKLGRVDATVHQKIAGEHKVEGFPTIKVFTGGSAESYNGGRSASDIVQFAENIIEQSLPPPEVKQVLDSGMFEEHCSSKSLCLIAFFPPIFDSSAEQRNKFIAIMKELAAKKTLKNYGFVWAESQQQQALEKAFNIGDFPALTALNSKKLRFANMRGAFSAEELSGFVGRLMSAREGTQALGELPAVKEAQAWDGKDAVQESHEEEMSLDDIMNEKLDA